MVHDAIFSDKISRELRPEIEKGVPGCVTELMKLCWDGDPTKRQTSIDLYKTLYSWLNTPTADVQQQFEAAEKHRQKKKTIMTRWKAEKRIRVQYISVDSC